MDPRLSVIDKRLENIKRIIAVSGGKGGIGKSVTASTLALSLAKAGHKVGLLDLDFTCPSTHIILGIKGLYPKEDKGIVPPLVYGLKYMSLIFYSSDTILPLRGIDISNAIIELLTITIWDDLHYLIIDMPPGIGDTTLDIIRLIKRIEFLIISTNSKVVWETVKKLLTLLKELKVPIIGVIENMKLSSTSLSNTDYLSLKEQVSKFDVRFLGTIEFDPTLELSIGETNKLLTTPFAIHIKECTSSLLSF